MSTKVILRIQGQPDLTAIIVDGQVEDLLEPFHLTRRLEGPPKPWLHPNAHTHPNYPITHVRYIDSGIREDDYRVWIPEDERV